MSLRDRPVLSDVPTLIKKGNSNTPTEAAVDVDRSADMVVLSQVARKRAAHDVEIASRLTVADARDLRAELDELIKRAEQAE